MAGNSRYLEAWFATIDERNRLWPATHENFELWLAQVNEGQQLWDLLLIDGWMVAELDAIFARRYGVTVDRPSQP